MREKVLIKGAGEQASATAHRLFRCGYRVVMTDLERPTAIRRTVAFCSAIYEGEIEIEGVRGALHRREDVGAREIIRAHPEWVGEFETGDEAVLFDVDLPVDLAPAEDGA